MGRHWTFTPQDTAPKPEGYSIKGWPARLRKEILGTVGCGPSRTRSHWTTRQSEAETFTAPQGYSDVSAHQANFFNAVRTRKPTVENEVFGNHAAIGCHWRITPISRTRLQPGMPARKRFADKSADQ